MLPIGSKRQFKRVRGVYGVKKRPERTVRRTLLTKQREAYLNRIKVYTRDQLPKAGLANAAATVQNFILKLTGSTVQTLTAQGYELVLNALDEHAAAGNLVEFLKPFAPQEAQ